MDLSKYYEKYSKEKVDEAIALLSYKNVDTLQKNASTSAPIIYVFRHGQSEDNSNFIFSGWRDAKLTEKGREQALALSDKLKDKNIGILITSDQVRTQETMALAISKNIAAKDLPVIKDPRIRERSYGVLEGKSKLEMQLENPELLKEYRRSYTKQAENGESMEMVYGRVFEFCKDLENMARTNQKNIAVCCSANSMRAIREYFEKLSPEQTTHVEDPLGQDYVSYVIL